MDAVLVLIGKRVEEAVKVQEILTDNGDIIKTRLGMNRELSKENDAAGFIFLELCANEQRINSLCAALNDIRYVKAECVSMDFPAVNRSV